MGHHRTHGDYGRRGSHRKPAHHEHHETEPRSDDDDAPHGGTPSVSLADELSRILGAPAEIVDNSIQVVGLRSVHVSVEGIPVRNVLTVPFAAAFTPVEPGVSPQEAFDRGISFLTIGETVLLTDEINPFISVLRAAGIDISALHNHWLRTSPPFWFMHFQRVGSPIAFARTFAEAFAAIGGA